MKTCLQLLFTVIIEKYVLYKISNGKEIYKSTLKSMKLNYCNYKTVKINKMIPTLLDYCHHSIILKN